MTRALIVVDVQESFRQGPRWAHVSDPDIAARAGRLVEAARDRGETVVWVLHTEPGSDGPFAPESGFVRVIEGLEPRPGEAVLTKTTRNSFTSTELQRLLTLGGIRELTICGIQTEQCCETTARVAGDYGYRVEFVTEATATFPIPHRDAPAGRTWDEIVADPRTLGTAEIKERTEYALAGRFADIRTLEEVLTR